MNKNILLVEDDPFLIDIYQKKLNQAGFQVVVAEDGEKALKYLKKQRPDLVLLDIVLPKLGGWEILQKLQQENKLIDLKIIILSNLGQKEEVAKGLELGAVKYLIKAQFTPGEVIEEIKKFLG